MMRCSPWRGRGRRLHRLHQVAFFGGDDEAELVAVVAAPIEEGAAVLHIALAVVSHFGKLDILVNNAAIAVQGKRVEGRVHLSSGDLK
jgi:NAD(P)-dependent dehydrogenase (short-subunit alcohol dehydrogenase family)